MCSGRDFGALSFKCIVFPKSLPQGSAIYEGEGIERLHEPEVADNLKETLIDTRGQCAYELTDCEYYLVHKFKSSKIPVQIRKSGHKLPHLAKKLSAINSC